MLGQIFFSPRTQSEDEQAENDSPTTEEKEPTEVENEGGESEVASASQKLADWVLSADEAIVHCTVDNLREFLGPRKYPNDRTFESMPPGVVMGLAYNQVGGSTIVCLASAGFWLPAATVCSWTVRGNNQIP